MSVVVRVELRECQGSLRRCGRGRVWKGKSACVVGWSGIGREGGMLEGAADWTVGTMDEATKAVLGYWNLGYWVNGWSYQGSIGLL